MVGEVCLGEALDSLSTGVPSQVAGQALTTAI